LVVGPALRLAAISANASCGAKFLVLNDWKDRWSERTSALLVSTTLLQDYPVAIQSGGLQAGEALSQRGDQSDAN